MDPDRLALHLRRLRLRHFEVLLAVSRHGSLTAAAQALDSSQPALSQWLAELEAAVGAPLFLRGRQLRPTPQLAPVLRHARRVLADSHRLDRELDAVSRGALGLVRIGSMTGPTLDLLPRALRSLRILAPAPQLELVEDIAQGLWERFARRELDLIVGRLDERAWAGGITAQALYPEPHCVVAGCQHPLASGQATWAAAARWPWVLPPRHTMLRRAIDASFLDEALAPPTPWLETASPGLIQQLLQDGESLAVMSSAAGRHHAGLGKLQLLPLRLKFDVGPIGMAWAEGDDSPALRQVLDAIRAAARAMPASGPPPAERKPGPAASR